MGSPVAGRSRRELEGLIGFFVNTLALRVDLGGRADVPRAAGPGAGGDAGRAGASGAAVRASGRGAGAGARASTARPLFQVMLAVQETAPELRAPGLTLRRLELEGGTAKFDLSLEVAPEGEELTGWIEYRRDLFEPATVRRLAGHLGTLLSAAGGGRRGAGLLPAAAERPRSAGSSRAWRRSPGLLGRAWARSTACSRRQARLRPEAVALVAGEQRMTYGELARRSGRWRGRCGGSGWDRRCGWGSPPSARRSWWWASWASCAPAASWCRSTRPIRRSGWLCSWRTRGSRGGSTGGSGGEAAGVGLPMLVLESVAPAEPSPLPSPLPLPPPSLGRGTPPGRPCRVRSLFSR